MAVLRRRPTSRGRYVPCQAHPKPGVAESRTFARSDDSAGDRITIGRDDGACAKRADSGSPIRTRLSAVPEAVLGAPSTPDHVTARGSSAGRSRVGGQSHRHGIRVNRYRILITTNAGSIRCRSCRRVPGRCCWSGGSGHPVAAGAIRPETQSDPCGQPRPGHRAEPEAVPRAASARVWSQVSALAREASVRLAQEINEPPQ
jgi:hypothetical protein